MKEILVLLFVVFSLKTSYSQCADVAVSVSSADTALVQLYHPGFFNLPSGFANVCEWEVTTFSGEIVYADTTSGTAFEQGLVLIEHSVPITDSMKVYLFITNEMEGTTCTINDTLFWEEIEVAGSLIGNWQVLSSNGGTEGVISSSYDSELVLENAMLFPSIVTDYFQIDGERQYYNLSIVNASGQLTAEHANIHMRQQVDASNLPTGFYFVQIRTKENKLIAIKKIIKN